MTYGPLRQASALYQQNSVAGVESADPHQLVSMLLEVDELLSMWRHRHIHMVQRTIGKRVGTGGSTGAEYLRGAADSHYIFKEIAELTSFLLPRNQLPALPEDLIKELSFR